MKAIYESHFIACKWVKWGHDMRYMIELSSVAAGAAAGPTSTAMAFGGTMNIPVPIPRPIISAPAVGAQVSGPAVVRQAPLPGLPAVGAPAPRGANNAPFIILPMPGESCDHISCVHFKCYAAVRPV